MLHFPPDKSGLILSAAFDVFVAYGFRKTSMDDIARAAGISRPALYQTFKNKQDIFRALSRSMLERACLLAGEEMQSDRPFAERLLRSLDASILSIHRIIDATPHGAELIGVNAEIAPDIERDWNDKLGAVWGDGFQRAADSGEITLNALDANDTARLFMHAMEGIKQAYMCGTPTEPEVRKLVTFFAASLAPKQ